MSRRNNNTKRLFIQAVQFQARLQLIEHLAAQPATATPTEQATRLIRANRGQGETRSILASNSNETTIIEVEN